METDGLWVCIDFHDFDVGVLSLVNMEQAVDSSRRTLLVLTVAWVKSGWTEFEALMQTIKIFGQMDIAVNNTCPF